MAVMPDKETKTQENRAPVYRIGNFEVDTSKNCLRRDGREIHLRRKTLRVLVYLLEERHRLVTHGELLEHVWENIAVTPDTLVQCVVEIRKALGDDPQNPVFIKTVPKGGYRFMGPVEVLTPSAYTEFVAETYETFEIEVEEESSRKLVRILFGGFAVLVLVAVAAVFLFSKLWGSPPHDAGLVEGSGRTVAVMFFENSSRTAELDWLREGLADMLITDLSSMEGINLLTRQHVSMLLDRRNYRGSTSVRLEDALVVAEKGGAEALVMGTFAPLGQTLNVQVQLYDVETGRLVAAERIVASQDEELLREMGRLSLVLSAHLGITTDPKGREGAADGLTTHNFDAYRLYSLAVEKANALHNREAISLLEQAIEIDPEFAMAHARIGYTFAVRWGRTAEAVPHLEKVLEMSERLTERDRLYVSGWYAIAQRDYPEAIRTFRSIIDRYPMEIEAYIRLGALLQGEERHDEALSIFERGLTIDPESAELYNSLGGVYLAMGNHERAIEAYQRYVSLAGREPNAFDSLGMSYQTAGRYERAIEAYEKAVSLDPKFEIAIVHLGNTYFRLGRYSDAVRQYERYIEVAPSDVERARGYRNIALVQLKRGDLRRAEEAAEQAVRLGALDGGFALALQRGDLRTARELRDKMLGPGKNTERGIRPALRIRYYIRGSVALESGREAEALDAFRQALRFRSLVWNIEDYEDCLANAYRELGQLDRAIAEYERILNINPRYPLAHYRCGLAHEAKGERDEAAGFYRDFLEIWENADPDIPEVMDAKRRLEDLSEK